MSGCSSDSDESTVVQVACIQLVGVVQAFKLPLTYPFMQTP